MGYLNSNYGASLKLKVQNRTRTNIKIQDPRQESTLKLKIQDKNYIKTQDPRQLKIHDKTQY